MSILQIFDQTVPLVSGYSMRSEAISKNLVRLGENITALSSPIFGYDKDDEVRDSVRYIRSRFPNPRRKRFPVLRELEIVKIIQERAKSISDARFSLVDAHSSVLNGIAGHKLSRHFGVPFLYEIRALWEDAAVDQGKTTEGSLRYRLTRGIETDVIKKADHITVICEGLRDDIIGRGISEQKITVIPNGVDLKDFAVIPPYDQEIAEKYHLRGRKVIGFIGTFFRFEGLEFLVQAAPSVLAKCPDTVFMLVGGGEREAALKQMVKEMNLESKVIFTGRVPHHDVLRYYSVMDALVYPRISKRITELVTPLKPLEAMALKKLVIGSSVGGIRELVKDGFNGMIFQKENAADLADKIVYAIENAGRLAALTENGRRYVETERDWLKICEGYKPVFQKLGVSR